MALYRLLRNLQFVNGIMLRLPAVIVLPLTAETWFRSPSSVCGNCVEEVTLGQVSAAVLRFNLSVSIHQCPFTIIRSTNGRKVGTFK